MFHYPLHTDSPTVRENLDRISEQIIQAIWFHLFLKMDELKTTDKKQVRILDRGIWNKDAGPDFIQAKIRIGNEVLTGDVELHWKTSDWDHHRHSENVSYKKVILHVVFVDDTKDKRMPTLAIGQYLNDSLTAVIQKIQSIQDDRKNIFCYDTVPTLEAGFLHQWILENGRQRFEAKCNKFEEQFVRQKTDLNELLYQGIMDALGFSKNREPFQRLAQKVPYQTLMNSIASDEEATALMRIQAIFLGAGGLLTEVKSLQVVPFVQRLENLWSEFQLQHKVEPMSSTEWKFFRLRPDNFPTLRLAGFSKLLVQNRNRPLLKTFILTFEKSSSNAFEDCISFLTVNSFGHWSEHYLLEDGGKRKQGDLIGRQRAFEIWVNAVLPVVALHAKFSSKKTLHGKVLQLYNTSTSLERNSILSYMKKQLRLDVVNRLTVQFAQGLIHLHKRCSAYACADCPVLTRVWTEERHDLMRLENEERYKNE
ncbi:DUF2851 family protein [bacterium]|nr:MAG: DUF2851 family protein [bacterium]